MTDRPALLKQIFTEARPYVERLVELNVVFTGFRKLATDNGMDWGQIKALLRAQIEDGETGSEKVDRIIKKAEFAGEYAALLGLGSANMNECNSNSALPPHDSDGVIIEPETEQSVTVGEGVDAPSAASSPLPSEAADAIALNAAWQISNTVDPPLPTAEPVKLLPVEAAGSSFPDDDLSIPKFLDRRSAAA